jgi:phosphopantetheine adenylyltransferase
VPEIEACILTREVEKGGQMVNDARVKNGLGEVDLVFVDMILAHQNQKLKNYSNKVSSTNIREYLSR